MFLYCGLLGPLSDRNGRRPVMLTGVVWFIVTCRATAAGADH